MNQAEETQSRLVDSELPVLESNGLLRAFPVSEMKPFMP
jgi:hypothetical protein